MTLSEFEQKVKQNSITDNTTIEKLFEFFYNMPIQDMYAKGIWGKPVNPIKLGYFAKNPNSTYADLIKEVVFYESEINPNDVNEYNNLLRLISEECVSFTPNNYISKKG